jgi:malic enzyme
MEEQLRRDALEYHRVPTSGKISVTPTKSLVNQRDLALVRPASPTRASLSGTTRRRGPRRRAPTWLR